MNEREGLILGVEVDINGGSYTSQLVALEEKKDMVNGANLEDGRLVKLQIIMLTMPQVEGGSNFSIKLIWSQTLLYDTSQFSLSIPFSFPSYVNPIGNNISRREKIHLNVNSGSGIEPTCKATTHPLKEVRRHTGQVCFSYEADVSMWSRTNFGFSYTISSDEIFGGLLLQSPDAHDFDQRDMFCFYLFPGSTPVEK
ncbi:hypothetical protein GIB67_009034 [Kingdonia uniflora]|uniref:Uncharacterized protein n=1 Tax=Kingdonia uniflora TaxID=39325 RepID=A0A7J7LW11_9MAGN|nr:hypothetical protein GIB67_009034 [Kingdonia uniflora]